MLTTSTEKGRLRALWEEMFPADKARLQLELNVELFRKRKGEDSSGPFDYTSHQVMLKLLVVYAHFFFEHSRWDWIRKVPHNALSVNIYYGLGSDSGPKSAIKRFKHVELWNFRRKA